MKCGKAHIFSLCTGYAACACILQTSGSPPATRSKGFGVSCLLDHHVAANGTSITFLHFIADTNLQQQTAGHQHLVDGAPIHRPPILFIWLFARTVFHICICICICIYIYLYQYLNLNLHLHLWSWFSPHMTSIFAQWQKSVGCQFAWVWVRAILQCALFWQWNPAAAGCHTSSFSTLGL